MKERRSEGERRREGEPWDKTALKGDGLSLGPTGHTKLQKYAHALRQNHTMLPRYSGTREGHRINSLLPLGQLASFTRRPLHRCTRTKSVYSNLAACLLFPLVSRHRRLSDLFHVLELHGPSVSKWPLYQLFSSPCGPPVDH